MALTVEMIHDGPWTIPMVSKWCQGVQIRSPSAAQGMQLVSSGYNPVLMQKGMKAPERVR